MGSVAVRVLAQPPDGRWDAYVADRPEASAYHRAVWPLTIARTFGHETRCLVAEQGDRIVGVLPLVLFGSLAFGRFAVSMPFLNYGGIVADGPAARQALLDAAVDETARAGGTHLELRHSTRQLPHLPARQHKVAMLLALERTPEAQWQALDRKVRNQIRKAEKHGVRIFRGGVELLPAFYSVFARNMRDLGTPVYPRRFFRQVLGACGEDAQVFCAWQADRPVAASITLRHRDRMEVPWASSLREYNSQCPNMLLYWQMLCFAMARGLTTFDFGRSTPHEGTYAFKKQWGAEPHALVWEYWLRDGSPLPDLSPKNPRYRAAIAIWRRLPVPVTRAVGPLIVRHIP